MVPMFRRAERSLFEQSYVKRISFCSPPRLASAVHSSIEHNLVEQLAVNFFPTIFRAIFAKGAENYIYFETDLRDTSSPIAIDNYDAVSR